MRIRIKLQNNKEIETDIGEEEYKELKQDLMKGKIKFLNFENQFLKTTLIEEIEPIVEPIPKEFGLPEPKFGNEDEKRIRVPGGWQKPSVRKRMIELFEQIKKQGCFKEFKDYFEWEKQSINPIKSRPEPWVNG